MAGTRGIKDSIFGAALKRLASKPPRQKGAAKNKLRGTDAPAPNSRKYKPDPSPLELEKDIKYITPEADEEQVLVREYAEKQLVRCQQEVNRLHSIRTMVPNPKGGPGAKHPGFANPHDAARLHQQLANVRKWSSWVGHLNTKDAHVAVRAQFLCDFQNWLRGAGREEDHQNTRWYRSPMTFDPSVREYLEAFVVERHEYIRALAHLNFRGPQNLDEAYLYFKYIVRGRGADMATQTFLADWDKFSPLMDGAWVTKAEIAKAPTAMREELKELRNKDKEFKKRVRGGVMGAKGTFPVDRLPAAAKRYADRIENPPLNEAELAKQEVGAQNVDLAIMRDNSCEYVPALRDKTHDWTHHADFTPPALINAGPDDDPPDDPRGSARPSGPGPSGGGGGSGPGKPRGGPQVDPSTFIAKPPPPAAATKPTPPGEEDTRHSEGEKGAEDPRDKGKEKVRDEVGYTRTFVAPPVDNPPVVPPTPVPATGRATALPDINVADNEEDLAEKRVIAAKASDEELRWRQRQKELEKKKADEDKKADAEADKQAYIETREQIEENRANDSNKANFRAPTTDELADKRKDRDYDQLIKRGRLTKQQLIEKLRAQDEARDLKATPTPVPVKVPEKIDIAEQGEEEPTPMDATEKEDSHDKDDFDVASPIDPRNRKLIAIWDELSKELDEKESKANRSYVPGKPTQETEAWREKARKALEKLDGEFPDIINEGGEPSIRQARAKENRESAEVLAKLLQQTQPGVIPPVFKHTAFNEDVADAVSRELSKPLPAAVEPLSKEKGKEKVSAEEERGSADLARRIALIDSGQFDAAFPPVSKEPLPDPDILDSQTDLKRLQALSQKTELKTTESEEYQRALAHSQGRLYLKPLGDIKAKSLAAHREALDKHLADAFADVGRQEQEQLQDLREKEQHLKDRAAGIPQEAPSLHLPSIPALPDPSGDSDVDRAQRQADARLLQRREETEGPHYEGVAEAAAVVGAEKWTPYVRPIDWAVQSDENDEQYRLRTRREANEALGSLKRQFDAAMSISRNKLYLLEEQLKNQGPPEKSIGAEDIDMEDDEPTANSEDRPKRIEDMLAKRAQVRAPIVPKKSVVKAGPRVGQVAFPTPAPPPSAFEPRVVTPPLPPPARSDSPSYPSTPAIATPEASRPSSPSHLDNLLKTLSSGLPPRDKTEHTPLHILKARGDYETSPLHGELKALEQGLPLLASKQDSTFAAYDHHLEQLKNHQLSIALPGPSGAEKYARKTRELQATVKAAEEAAFAAKEAHTEALRQMSAKKKVLNLLRQAWDDAAYPE